MPKKSLGTADQMVLDLIDDDARKQWGKKHGNRSRWIREAINLKFAFEEYKRAQRAQGRQVAEQEIFKELEEKYKVTVPRSVGIVVSDKSTGDK